MRSKYFYAITLVLITLGTISFTLPKAEKVEIKTKIYCDHCDACESCKPHIVASMEDIRGVKGVELNVKDEVLTVWYSAKKTNPELLRDALRKSGFEADGQAPYPDAYDKLDECCKK